MRDEIQIVNPIVIDISTTERIICHAGTLVSAVRKFISSGEQNGISEITCAIVEAGARTVGNSITMQNASGSTKNIFNCCSSCSELVIAPSAAAIDEYSRKPKMKYRMKKPIWAALRTPWIEPLVPARCAAALLDAK